MKIYDYLSAAFIIIGAIAFLVYFLRRRKMPRPPEPKWFGDDDGEDDPK